MVGRGAFQARRVLWWVVVDVKPLRLAFRARERLVVGGGGCETRPFRVLSEEGFVVDGLVGGRGGSLHLTFGVREGRA